MSHAPEGLYQLPDGINQRWNGAHWVPGPQSDVLTVVDAEPAVPRRWSWSESALASSWRRALS